VWFDRVALFLLLPQTGGIGILDRLVVVKGDIFWHFLVLFQSTVVDQAQVLLKEPLVEVFGKNHF